VEQWDQQGGYGSQRAATDRQPNQPSDSIATPAVGCAYGHLIHQQRG
jgi:hypothetical protein